MLQAGLQFSNFSMRNLFKKDAWRPIPAGDGQKLSLNLTTYGVNSLYYGFSFTEPWFGGKKPNKAAIKLPLRDGDVERDDEAYKGHWFINANSNTAPQIVDRAVNPILDKSEVYSGCYARVSLNFYAFNSNGNKGIACGLGNIQKVRDGEPLGGRTNAADDFATLDDEDFLA